MEQFESDFVEPEKRLMQAIVMQGVIDGDGDFFKTKLAQFYCEHADVDYERARFVAERKQKDAMNKRKTRYACMTKEQAAHCAGLLRERADLEGLLNMQYSSRAIAQNYGVPRWRIFQADEYPPDTWTDVPREKREAVWCALGQRARVLQQLSSLKNEGIKTQCGLSIHAVDYITRVVKLHDDEVSSIVRCLKARDVVYRQIDEVSEKNILKATGFSLQRIKDNIARKRPELCNANELRALQMFKIRSQLYKDRDQHSVEAISGETGVKACVVRSAIWLWQQSNGIELINVARDAYGSHFPKEGN